MSYLKRVFQGTVFTLLSTFVIGIIGYFLKIFLARNLSVEDYGLVFATFSFFNAIMIFYGFGLDVAIVKFVPEFKVKKKDELIRKAIFSSFFFQIAITFIFSILLYLFKDFLIAYIFKSGITKSFFILGIFYFFISPFSIVEAYIRALQKFKFLTLFNIIKNLFFFGSTLILFNTIEQKAMSLLLAYTFFNVFLGFSLLIYIIINKINVLKNFDFNILKRLIFFSSPLFFVSLFTQIFNKMDEIFLAFLSNFSEVGYFSVADSTINATLTILTTFSVAYFPIISEMYAKNQKKEIERTLMLILKYLFLIIFPIVILINFYSREIILILFGSKFIESSVLLFYYSPALIFSPLIRLFAPILMSANETKYVAFSSLSSFFIDFIGNILLVPKYGAKGAIISSIFGLLVYFFMLYFKTKKTINFMFNFKSIFSFFVSLFIFSIIMFLLKNKFAFFTIEVFDYVFVCGLSFFAYTILLIFFRFVSLNEIEKIIGLFNQKTQKEEL